MPCPSPAPRPLQLVAHDAGGCRNGDFGLRFADVGVRRVEPPLSRAKSIRPSRRSAIAASPSPQPLRPAQRQACSKRPATGPYDKTFDDIRFEMKLDEPFRRAMLTPAIETLSGQRDPHPRLHAPHRSAARHQAVRARARQPTMLLRPGRRALRLHPGRDAGRANRPSFRFVPWP